MFEDPVCGMQVDESTAAASRRLHDTTYHFCSETCAAEFDADPSKYVGPTEHGTAHRHRPVPSITVGVSDEIHGPVRAELPLVNIDCATCVQAK